MGHEASKYSSRSENRMQPAEINKIKFYYDITQRHIYAGVFLSLNQYTKQHPVLLL